jgi:hypothetical protein
MRFFIPEGRLEMDCGTLVCSFAEAFEKDWVPQEMGMEHSRQSQNVMPVRDRSEDAPYGKGCRSLDVFLKAGRAESAVSTGKSWERIEPAGVAMDAG